jgi:hypothetical protein
MQYLVVGVITCLWAIGVILAAFDGTVMLKATTPAMTLVIGWLLTAKLTEA